MPPNLDELRDRALEEAAKTGTLADIAQAVTIAKAIAEERKADEELAAARRTFTLSRTQSLVAGITAIVSVAGLVATSVYNIAQLSATREQVETTEWRDLLSSIDRLNTRVSESLTVPFRLRSFAASKRYSEDARLIGATVMSQMADLNGFRQLFNFIFSDQKLNDLPTMVQIQKQLVVSNRRVESECSDASQKYQFPNAVAWHNICWSAYNDKQVQDFGLKPDDIRVWTLRKTYQAQGDELYFMSQKIADAMRAARSPQKDVNLTDIYVANVDLGNVDFLHFDISGSSFNTDSLTGANLRPFKYEGATFIGSDWWDAANVDKDLLQYLIDYQYPMKDTHFFSPARPTKLEYVTAVLSLCRKVGLACTESKIPYEEDQTGF